MAIVRRRVTLAENDQGACRNDADGLSGVSVVSTVATDEMRRIIAPELVELLLEHLVERDHLVDEERVVLQQALGDALERLRHK